MDKECIDKLVLQIDKVVLMLDDEIGRDYKPMFELILRRYRNAKDILIRLDKDEKALQNVRVAGSVRAFLEASSDYVNPILEEMFEAETLFNEIMTHCPTP